MKNHRRMSDYVDTLLIKMEQEKWIEHFDEFNEKTYYIHSETGAVKTSSQKTRYVPRALRDERGKHIGKSAFFKFLKRRKHQTHYPKGWKKWRKSTKKTFTKWWTRNTMNQQGNENYVDGYDEYDGEDTMVMTNG